MRAIAERAYERGAKFVDVTWFDPWVKRARVAHAPDDTLEYVPPWYGERMLALGRERGAAITLSGPVAPGLLDDLDPVRAGRDRLPAIRESGEVVSRRELNWTILPGPTPAWANLVHPDLDEDAALAKLEEQLLHVLRLDTDDPVAAWRERADTLVAVAGRLTERGFDALHYEGPEHRPDRRAAGRDAMAGRAVRDRRRHPAHAEPPDRRGLHVAGPDAGRRSRRVIEAARADGRDRRARHGRALRERPRGRADGVDGAGDDADDHRPRRGRGAARRGRAGRRRGPDRGARTPSSTTRCSTRTPPRIWRSAARSRSWPRTRSRRRG